MTGIGRGEEMGQINFNILFLHRTFKLTLTQTLTFSKACSSYFVLKTYSILH